MSLTVPARVVGPAGEGWRVVDLGGVEKEVSTALVDEIAVGDYLDMHVGFALAKLDVADAEATLDLLRDLVEPADAALEPAPKAFSSFSVFSNHVPTPPASRCRASAQARPGGSVRHPTAVDHEVVAGDEARLLARQK